MSGSRLLAVARQLERARHIGVLTGAGVSAPSGIPTFRGADGLWRNHRADDLATPRGFARDPKLVWEWYDWRRGLIAAAEPNAAHHVLARWQHRFERCTIATQNVDGLHERAGADVLRLHGSIWRVACHAGCAGSPADWEDLRVPLAPLPPPCPHCGGIIRPAVVWFGEPLPLDVFRKAYDAAEACDVFLVIGTSAIVQPAASLWEHARGAGAFVVEINPTRTVASDEVDVSVQADAAEALASLDAALAK